MQILIVFFGMIPFLKTDAVLNHLPVWSHTHTHKNTRSSVKCWDQCDRIKTITEVKSKVPSINYPHFAKIFRFFLL